MSRTKSEAEIVSEEQLVPHANILVIKKNNQRVASNSHIIETMLRFVDEILRHYKLYNPVSLTTTIPIIYLYQFWTTINHNKNNHTFTFELDNHTFSLTYGLLRTVLQMPPPDPNNTYIQPPLEIQILEFIKTLGYDEDPNTKLIVVSKMVATRHHQPWGAILSGSVHSANLDFASLIWDEFKWQAIKRSSRPSKMSMMLYTYFTKLITDYLHSLNKSIPQRSDSKLHSSQDDHPITKLLNTTNGEYKFGMEIPDAIINDPIKKKVRYKYYMTKKVESEEAEIVDKLEEQHVSLIKSGRGKDFMCYGDQVENVPNKLKKDVVPRKTRSLTIIKEVVIDTTSDTTLYSSSSDKLEDCVSEIDDADESDMDLSDDNLQGDDDAEMFPEENAHHISSLPAKKISYPTTTPQPRSLQAKAKKLMQKAKKNMRKINFKKAVTQKFREYDQKLDALTNFNVSEAFEKAVHAKVLTEIKKLLPTHIPNAIAKYVKSHLNTSILDDPSNNYEGENKKKRRKDVSEPSSRSSRRNRSPVVIVKDDTPALQPLDQANILIQKHSKPEWFPKKYTNDVELKYHVSQLKAAVLSEAQWNSDEGDVSKPRSFERHMSKSTKSHPCFYNNDYTYLVDLSTEEKYTTFITKHYAARYYKEGIEDRIPERWSKEVRHYHFEALNVRRSDDKEYEFSYADLPRLSVNDVEYITVIKNKVEDIHLRVESYQRTLNLTKPIMFFEGIDQRIPFTMTATHKGVVHLNQYNIKSLMKLCEVKKLCDGTLVKIQENLIDMLSKNKLASGNKRLKGRDWTDYDVKSSKEMLKKIDKLLRPREHLMRLEEYV
ncbi:hypothetical protein Tco_0129004 [Tanacetum coccineum]